MLALKRKNGQSIVIKLGVQSVTVTLRETKSTSAKLCIDAPKEVRILRSELIKESGISGLDA